MDAKRSSKRCLQRQNWHPRALRTFLAISFFALQFLSFLFGMQRLAKTNDKNRRFGVIMTPLSRRNKK